MLYKTGKRLMDIVGACVAITIFSPIFILCAIWIKLVSKGPILADIPLRAGINKKKFKFYKFRSMVPNAQQILDSNKKLKEQYLKNNYKLDNDPRWIKGGGFMRKYSLDEFPQFFNVLKGDMSLVGPRAYLPNELDNQVEKFPEAKEYVEKLLTIKPGLTGPWQVGGRSQVNFVERVKIDAKYADNRSLIYDIILLLKTPLAVIQAKGAY